MKAEFVRDTIHDFAEALRANPLAAGDGQELIDVLNLNNADLISAKVPEADLQQIILHLTAARRDVAHNPVAPEKRSPTS